MGTVSISGTEILMDGKPFCYQGLSFFNALYNPNFNMSDEDRRRWLKHIKSWGITALRIWGDWRTTNDWVDEGPDNSLWAYPGHEGRNVLYEPEGALNEGPLSQLKRLLSISDDLRMVVEIALFTHYMVYPVRTRDDYMDLVTEELKPWRNRISSMERIRGSYPASL